MNPKFITAFLMVLGALVVEIGIQDSITIAWGLTLVVLIAAAFFLELPEIIFCALFAAFVLNSQPGISFEMIIFFAISVITYFSRTLMPLMPLPGILFFIVCATLLLYLMFAPGLILARPALIVSDLIASAGAGFIAFLLLREART